MLCKNLYLCRRLLKCQHWLVINEGRNISTELATALRPFYFEVHPDLFAQHPLQRQVNEDSLKQLIAHIELLYERKYQVLRETKTLKFYIRDCNANYRDTFKLVQITLDHNVHDPKYLIQNLLELCQLPTNYVKSLKSVKKEQLGTNKKATGFSNNNASSSFTKKSTTNGTDYSTYEYNISQAKEKSLIKWIKLNGPLAKSRTSELAGLKEEVAKLQKSVVKRLNLLDAQYECGWNFEHYRGCLKTLERMADMHEEQMGALKGRTVVFASFTGISLEGHVMLFTGDVVNNWREFIKNIPEQDKFLKKIPNYENTLSQVLRNIQIGRRKFMPKQQAVEYAGYLMKITTTLGDYLSYNKFPSSWPLLLNQYKIVIESEAGPLMVSPTGQLIAPATCPGFMLIDFITANLNIAKERMAKYEEEKYVEKELIQRCIKVMKLNSLTKDDSVTPEKMIDALNKLLTCDAEFFNEIDLHITNYYSVMTDGIVCIPWDFIPRS